MNYATSCYLLVIALKTRYTVQSLNVFRLLSPIHSPHIRKDIRNETLKRRQNEYSFNGEHMHTRRTTIKRDITALRSLKMEFGFQRRYRIKLS